MSQVVDGESSVQLADEPVQQPAVEPKPTDGPVVITLPNVPVQPVQEEAKTSAKPVKPKAPRKPAIKKSAEQPSVQQTEQLVQPGEPEQKPRVQIVEEVKQPEQRVEEAEEQIDTSSRREPLPPRISAESKAIRKEERLSAMFKPAQTFASHLFQRNQEGQTSWQRIRDRLNKGDWSKQRFK